MSETKEFWQREAGYAERQIAEVERQVSAHEKAVIDAKGRRSVFMEKLAVASQKLADMEKLETEKKSDT